ncbi:MAG: SirB2 family protein [Mizugakiibacter sp.]|uniref:SirB2 family protein n=1 Tax=Mizugakiibacter sp. TaxID=1972610 RepID=UPI0031C8226D|nr:SirB2 family protein [Xanthomonadaceae bacterium]
MALAYFYPQIKLLHIWCVALSGTLFLFRGSLRLAGIGLANHAALRYLSYAIDTTLLTAALMLVVILHQYPFVQAWLTVKLLLLVVYIVLGTIALKRGRTPRVRAGAFVAALAVFGFIISVAIAHDARGVFALLS